MRWRCRNSARANREHCNSNYYMTAKKTLTALNGVCMTRSSHHVLCAKRRSRRAPQRLRIVVPTRRSLFLSALQKHRIHKGFRGLHFFRSGRLTSKFCDQIRGATAFAAIVDSYDSPSQNFFHKSARASSLRARFRRESSESLQTDSLLRERA